MKIPYQDRLGLPGILGLGLLLFCLSFYLGTIAPARTELRQLTSEETQLTAGAAAEAGVAVAVATRAAAPSVTRARKSRMRLMVRAFTRTTDQLHAPFTCTAEAGSNP